METVGILGGGQLARMLILEGYPLGINPIVIAGSADDPAAQVAAGGVFGEIGDVHALRRLFAQVDRVIFENEFVPCDVIEAALGEVRRSPALYPALGVIRDLQDKLKQKEVLSRLRIPTARYQKFEGGETKAWIAHALQTFPAGAVFKWARLGYDGLGTCILSDTTAASVARAEEFATKAAKKGVPLYVEEKIRFKRELALIACRSVTGEFGAWPLVITEQEYGVCKRVQGPAIALGVSDALESEARRHAGELARALSIVGTFAMEFFETEGGSLCVNELAPRVHNSGHFTLDASPTSQFENHWRAVLGLPLGDFGSSSRSGLFAMLNLLGPATLKGPASARAQREGIAPELHLHWYGKREVRAGRKMGHVNGEVSQHDHKAFSALLEKLTLLDRKWEKTCLGETR